MSIPKSLEWYTDGSKWLVTISTGAIVFGFGLIKDIDSFNSSSKLLLAVSSIGLLLTCISGVLTFFFISSYADVTEFLNQNNTLSTSKKAQKVALKSKLNQMANLWFKVMLWSFTLGMFLFSAFGLNFVFKSKGKANPAFSITSLKEEGNELLISNSSNGQFWQLSQDSTGNFQIKEVFKMPDQEEK